MSTERKNPSMMHIGSEVVAALCSAFLVSPTNAILDRSVIEYANGKQSVNDGVRNGFNRLFTTPLQFFTSFKFKWMFFVYGMTYGASNLADHVNLSDSINHPIQKLGIVFIVNTICGILKDKAYIQKFGTSTTPKIFPPIALVLLFARDLITMASAFTFPPIIGKLLQQRSKLSARASQNIVQILSPLLIQILVTPLHLMGLDLYNRPGETLGSRIKNVRKLYISAMTLRMIRFLPAYGLGGVFNKELRGVFTSMEL